MTIRQSLSISALRQGSVSIKEERICLQDIDVLLALLAVSS